MKKLNLILKGIFVIVTLIILSHCKPMPNNTAKDVKTLIVASETKDCTGVAPMKCLQVKEKESDSWQNFYSNIEGFTYQPGFEYILKVRTEKIENPPMDRSSLKYFLVKEISKVKK